MRKCAIFLSAVFVFLAVASSVSAIAIVPARTSLEYVPGKTVQLSFGIGSFGEGMTYETVLAGEYVENAKVLREDSNSILVEFTMPEHPTPGQHELLVGISQVPLKEYDSGGVAAKAAVYSQVRFFVPYPAKYAEITLDNVDVAYGKRAYFTVHFMNYGTDTLKNVKGTISILDLQNKTVAIVPLSVMVAPFENSREFYSMENTEMYGQWDTENQSTGAYRTIAHVNYDGMEAIAEAMLRVGTLDIKVNGIRAVGNVKSGVVKINIDLESLWNQPLSNIYAIGQVLSNDTVLASNLKSASADLEAWGKNTLVLYWDVYGLSVGVYDVNARLYFENKTKEISTQIYLAEEEQPAAKASHSSLYIAILMLAIAVAFVAIIIFKVVRANKNE